MALLEDVRGSLNDWTELWFNDSKRTGYVALTDFKKQLFFGANDVKRIIDITQGRERQYISINSFKGWNDGISPNRETTNLKQIRNIAIDIDQYEKGLTIDEVIDELQVMVLENVIPEPNLVLTSRGVQLFYTLENGASPSMAWLTTYITSQFIAKLEHIGADYNAKDVSRVMRVPNSINERNGATVKPSIWNSTPYTLDELQSYCRPLTQGKTRKRKKNKVVSIGDYERVSLIYKINYSRLQDLKKLIQLRNGNFTGMRNKLLYMYAYHEALLFNTKKDTVTSVEEAFKDVYSTKDKPMSKREFERTVKSAYDDAQAFFEHFKANGYQIIYKANDGIKKPYKTSNVIEMLGIAEREQLEMNTLHSPEIKRQKDIKRLERNRRQQGMRTMDEYNNDRKQKQQSKLDELQQLLKDKPTATRKELAELLGVSTRQLYRLLKSVT